jgi:hypothetical protein
MVWRETMKQTPRYGRSVCLSVCLPIYMPIYPSIHGSTALVDLGRFFSFLIYTQSVGLLGQGISPSRGRYLYIEPHDHRYPCLEWDSNPRPQCSCGRPLWSPATTMADNRINADSLKCVGGLVYWTSWNHREAQFVSIQISVASDWADLSYVFSKILSTFRQILQFPYSGWVSSSNLQYIQFKVWGKGYRNKRQSDWLMCKIKAAGASSQMWEQRGQKKKMKAAH